jgi:hypothetical protein
VAVVAVMTLVVETQQLVTLVALVVADRAHTQAELQHQVKVIAVEILHPVTQEQVAVEQEPQVEMEQQPQLVA